MPRPNYFKPPVITRGVYGMYPFPSNVGFQGGGFQGGGFQGGGFQGGGFQGGGFQGGGFQGGGFQGGGGGFNKGFGGGFGTSGDAAPGF